MSEPTPLQKLFEQTHPMPKHCIRVGDHYASTEYSAWKAHEFVTKFDGFKQGYAAGQASRPTIAERLETVGKGTWVDGMSWRYSEQGQPYAVRIAWSEYECPDCVEVRGADPDSTLDAAIAAAARETGGQGE